MTLTPMTRDSMRTLRDQHMEDQRNLNIKNIVSEIYKSAVHVAKETTETMCLYRLPVGSYSGYNGTTLPSDFYKTSMTEIICRVQSLFPECSVEHTTMATTRDGKKHKVPKINEDLKPFMIHDQISEYIVVDWS